MHPEVVLAHAVLDVNANILEFASNPRMDGRVTPASRAHASAHHMQAAARSERHYHLGDRGETENGWISRNSQKCG
jgi:hypothetical protein